MENKTALIVIDSGFSVESLEGADQVIAFIDVVRRRTAVGAPYLKASELGEFANDPGNHGSIVLSRLRNQAPGNPLILIRAIDPSSGLVRTGWSNGEVTSLGWTEAYLKAVDICRARGLTSVANCSFGGVVHAADGTGWEAHQLLQVTGAGKPGHIVVAAAGAGDGRACHASWVVPAGSAQTVEAFQKATTHYNFWAGGVQDWHLEVFMGNRSVLTCDGRHLPHNFWNNRQQLNFVVEGEGLVTFVVKREDATRNGGAPLRFDCWVVRDTAYFHDHVDPTLIVEPAVYPSVIAVGLVDGTYSPSQALPGHKPDVLLKGVGPISFRLPAVTAAVAACLDQNASLDVEGIKKLLGKTLG